MRVVFMGTPQFAVTVLKIIHESHEVVAVVSQPDRAKDRKGNFINTPVKEFALKNQIPVYQFEKIKNNTEVLKAFNADVFVTAAYGQILSQEVLDIPKFGVLNVHASLLPKYRGSSPIQTAILNGEEETGVAIMQTELGMDTGDILAMRSIKINNMNTGELSEVLSELGGELLIEVLNDLLSGNIKPIKQDDLLATKCKKIDKEAAEINWSRKSDELFNAVRAYNPSPVAYTFYNGQRIKIYEVTPCNFSGKAGEILFAEGNMGLIVACGEGALSIKTLQAPGKRVMTCSEFLNGNKIKVGDYFGK